MRIENPEELMAPVVGYVLQENEIVVGVAASDISGSAAKSNQRKTIGPHHHVERKNGEMETEIDGWMDGHTKKAFSAVTQINYFLNVSNLLTPTKPRQMQPL